VGGGWDGMRHLPRWTHAPLTCWFMASSFQCRLICESLLNMPVQAAPLRECRASCGVLWSPVSPAEDAISWGSENSCSARSRFPVDALCCALLCCAGLAEWLYLRIHRITPHHLFLQKYPGPPRTSPCKYFISFVSGQWLMMMNVNAALFVPSGSFSRLAAGFHALRLHILWLNFPLRVWVHCHVTMVGIFLLTFPRFPNNCMTLYPCSLFHPAYQIR